MPPPVVDTGDLPIKFRSTDQSWSYTLRLDVVTKLQVLMTLWGPLGFCEDPANGKSQ